MIRLTAGPPSRSRSRERLPAAPRKAGVFCQVAKRTHSTRPQSVPWVNLAAPRRHGVQARWSQEAPTFALAGSPVAGGECWWVVPWLAQVLRHVTVSEVGVPMAPAVQTGPASEQQCVVPEAQALGSLAQVCLPLGAQVDTQCKIKEQITVCVARR